MKLNIKGERAIQARTSEHIAVVVTPGSIKNSYLLIEGFEFFFPTECFGGGNKEEAGVVINLNVKGISDIVVTDIAGDKRIVRKRGWCRRFYESHWLEPGHRVIIERVGDYEYNVYPEEVL